MSRTSDYYDRADTLCCAFMALRPDLLEKSLDEWLLVYDSQLSDEEKAAGWSILALHPDCATFDYTTVAANPF